MKQNVSALYGRAESTMWQMGLRVYYKKDKSVFNKFDI